jgi:hypothetical protein
MIDPFSEHTFPLAEAARRLPRLRSNRPVAVSTVWRWARRGLRGVVLETALVGGVRVTSAAALREFFARLDRRPVSPRPTVVNQDAVEKELDRVGIR